MILKLYLELYNSREESKQILFCIFTKYLAIDCTVIFHTSITHNIQRLTLS